MTFIAETGGFYKIRLGAMECRESNQYAPSDDNRGFCKSEIVIQITKITTKENIIVTGRILHSPEWPAVLYKSHRFIFYPYDDLSNRRISDIEGLAFYSGYVESKNK